MIFTKNKYAGFWRRVGATLIDVIILGVATGFTRGNQAASLIAFVFQVAYYVWMNGTYGATVGKMVFKIKITKENGGKISYNDALIRVLGSFLSGIALGLGYLWVIWDPKKQSWHDKIAKTIVIKS